MTALHFDEGRLRRDVRALESDWHRCAWICATAERLLPWYTAFVRVHKWGDQAMMRKGLDTAWQHVGLRTSSDLSALMAKCDDIIPHAEDFESFYVSPAINTGACVVTALEACMDPSSAFELSVDAGTMGRDLADYAVQELNQMDPNSADLEERIIADPLMQRELAHQQEILDLLASRPRLDVTDVLELRQLAAAQASHPLATAG